VNTNTKRNTNPNPNPNPSLIHNPAPLWTWLRLHPTVSEL